MPENLYECMAECMLVRVAPASGWRLGMRRLSAFAAGLKRQRRLLIEEEV